MEKSEAFLYKCQEGIFTVIETFLSEGILPDVQNAEGETGLQISAANGYLDIVKLLLKRGASVDLANNYGWTPLMHAVRHGHFDVVSYLIKMNANINITNRLGVRPIDVASWNGDLSCLKLIIEAGAIIDKESLNDVQNDLCDISPLMAVSLQGHLLVLQILLEKESPVNQVSHITGLTPLMLAACNGDRDIIEMLIECGCDANITDIYCRTALDLAYLCGRENVIKILEGLTQPLTKKAYGCLPYDTVLQIVRSGDITEVKSLLKRNQKFSNYICPDDGVTPLMIASMLGFVDITDLLISNGANLNSQDRKHGWTPLMYAVFHRQSKIVRLLIKRGADVAIYTPNSYTAYDLAVHTGDLEADILEALLSHSYEKLDTTNCLETATTIKQSHLTIEKASSRTDSLVKLKGLLGVFPSQLSELSKSSATSPTIDSEILDETLYDVFSDDSIDETLIKKPFLCMSLLYSPEEHLAYQLKLQEVEAIDLPPLPSPAGAVPLINNVCLTEDKSTSTKPHFNSLRIPNLVRKAKNYYPVWCDKKNKRNIFSESLSVQDVEHFSEMSAIEESLSNSSLQSINEDYDGVLKEKIEVTELSLAGSTLKNSLDSNQETLTNCPNSHKQESKLESNTAFKGLTALLDQESFKKYAVKFRDQEIDLETFKYLTEEDLNEIGISSFDSRHKLMEIIDKLKKS